MKQRFYRTAGLRPLLRPMFWASPYTYLLVGLIRQKKNILSIDFDMIIDGYPRSANTFAVQAFEYANAEKRIKVRSHLHSPAAVIAAVSMRKPALVLVREPRDAICSATVINRFPLKYTIDSYVNYYSRLLPVTAQVCVATFEQVTENFADVVDRVNAKFKCEFSRMEISKENSSMIMRKIETDYESTYGRLEEVAVSRPSAIRDDLKQIVSIDMDAPAFEKSLAKARRLYEHFALAAGAEPREARKSESRGSRC